MLVISLGKRVEGGKATLTNNQLGALGAKATFSDARIVYTVTVGRFSWTPRDLAEKYNATCKAEDKNCEGLHFQLRDHNGSGKKLHHLVVGQNDIEMDILSPYAYKYSQRYQETRVIDYTEWTPLVEVRTHRRQKLRGDLIPLEHFADVSWTASKEGLSGANCSAEAENYINHLELNHLYIDGDGIQEAYSAGLFFVFQNAAERSVVMSGKMQTLAFDNNIQMVDAVALIPKMNAMVSAGGVLVLVLTALIVVIIGKPRPKVLAEKLDAQSLAQVFIDSTRFPPLLLQKSLTMNGRTTSEEDLMHDLHQYRIHGVVLGNEKDKETTVELIGTGGEKPELRQRKSGTGAV
ncbi:TPA: hypothetical protein N0F65_009100 [Lagenidium giganteum]|uniref:Uncharacterized protein n=1 Tax=Lagenidium giganteum TaxID=4803 RepID=A0AAV2YRI2_9STRA|nr:TPA: hypothetical protein N0F65_009100 [Lagenidium giganteum]